MRIVLVDDEDPLRQIIAHALQRQGFLVEEASNYQEAMLALRQPADVLVIDVNLPDATGWDILRALRERDISVPTIVIAAVPPSVRRLQEFRPFGTLQKPFPLEALVRLIHRAVRPMAMSRDQVGVPGD